MPATPREAYRALHAVYHPAGRPHSPAAGQPFETQLAECRPDGGGGGGGGLLRALCSVTTGLERHARAELADKVHPSARVLSLCCTPLSPSVGVSIAMERECQQNDTLADG